ncbi:MAG TPA: hypothetical protein DDZ39_10725 [Flavobacteriaceae bacterium]|jgi:hypothetical protein|nr:hypothetical protein [Flavobacteriaceae bacterium]HBS11905.1 hypothetical protein [Flavobacteriaceae bacterium]
MREEIISWVKECVNVLIKDFQENDEVKILIKAFVTQYELNTIRSIESNKNLKYNNQLNYAKQKIKNKIIKTQKPSIGFSLKPKQIDVLFLPFQKMHLDVVLPIYQNIVKNESIKVGLVSNNLSIQSWIKNKNIENSIFINDLEPFWVDYKKNKYYYDIIKSVEKLQKLSVKNKKIDFKEILLFSWNSWYWLYDSTLKMFDKIVENYSPKAIFVGNTITLVGNIVAHLAAKKKIKVFCMMHGRMNDYIQFSKFDYFYLFGVRDRDNLMKLGVSDNKLIVSGSPKIERFLTKTNKVTDSNHNKNILVALSGPGHSITVEHHILIVKLIYKLALEFKKVQFKIKLHKKDRITYYEDIIVLSNVSIYESGDMSVSSNIYDWIVNSDLLITGASTSALDAMLLDLPVVTIDILKHLENVDFINEKATFHATTYNDLQNHVNSILGDDLQVDLRIKKAKKFSQQFYTQPKEGSVNLMTKHLIKVLNEA